ncbi:hypothetical protein JTB14_020725 [Gonioctena quinquepunctata]|nr:hypothetical protein JTB14_020725 [Gonioctena quinquepunctata]
MLGIDLVLQNEETGQCSMFSLQEFQRKQGIEEVIDCFPKFYGARTNLENSDGKIDENAILILENLKIKGYRNVDRYVGCDLQTTKVLLRDIAHFHAVPLALKLKDPETFEKKVKAYLACHHPPAPVPPTEEPAAYIIEVLKESKTIEHLLPKLQKSFKYFGGYPESFREPFSTLVHRDLWVNNIMVRFENGEAVDSNLVDFQYYSYDSPATDLFFFLCTSVEKETLENNFDDLLKYYHKIFCDTLKSLKCDTDPFSYELFLEEIAASTERELARSIFMLFFIIHGQKGGLPRPQDTSKPPSIKGHTIRDETKEKVWWILEECEKRGWMNF